MQLAAKYCLRFKMPLTSRSGHLTENGWNVPAERPEINPEEYRSERTGKNSRSEPIRDRLNETITHQAYDTWEENPMR